MNDVLENGFMLGVWGLLTTSPFVCLFTDSADKVDVMLGLFIPMYGWMHLAFQEM